MVAIDSYNPQEMDQAGLATLLVGREPEAIIRTLAMMSYNPAIGRVLEEGGVLRFSDLMASSIPEIYGALVGSTFDAWHAEMCARILNDFRTSRGQKLAYGQAKKPLNVFIDKEIYLQWQQFLRSLWPGKPVQLDIVWVLERRPSGGESQAC